MTFGYREIRRCPPWFLTPTLKQSTKLKLLDVMVANVHFIPDGKYLHILSHLQFISLPFAVREKALKLLPGYPVAPRGLWYMYVPRPS